MILIKRKSLDTKNSSASFGISESLTKSLNSGLVNNWRTNELLDNGSSKSESASGDKTSSDLPQKSERVFHLNMVQVLL